MNPLNFRESYLAGRACQDSQVSYQDTQSQGDSQVVAAPVAIAAAAGTTAATSAGTSKPALPPPLPLPPLAPPRLPPLLLPRPLLRPILTATAIAAAAKTTRVRLRPISSHLCGGCKRDCATAHRAHSVPSRCPRRSRARPRPALCSARSPWLARVVRSVDYLIPDCNTCT